MEERSSGVGAKGLRHTARALPQAASGQPHHGRRENHQVSSLPPPPNPISEHLAASCPHRHTTVVLPSRLSADQAYRVSAEKDDRRCQVAAGSRSLPAPVRQVGCDKIIFRDNIQHASIILVLTSADA